MKEPKLKDFAEKLNIVLQKTHDEINGLQSTAKVNSSAVTEDKTELSKV